MLSALLALVVCAGLVRLLLDQSTRLSGPAAAIPLHSRASASTTAAVVPPGLRDATPTGAWWRASDASRSPSRGSDARPEMICARAWPADYAPLCTKHAAELGPLCSERALEALAGSTTPEERWPAPRCTSHRNSSLNADVAPPPDQMDALHAAARLGPHAECVRGRAQPPMMTASEIEFARRLLAAMRPRVYLEWGSGLSTAAYPLFAEQSMVVDNYQPWCDRVQAMAAVKCLSDRGALNYTCVQPPRGVSVGDTGRISNPAHAAAMFDAYVVRGGGAVLDELGRRNLAVHAALVDGRFRAACALRLLPYLAPGAVVLLHDFWSRLHAHRRVLRYYDVLGRSGSLGALRPKPLPPVAGPRGAEAAAVGGALLDGSRGSSSAAPAPAATVAADAELGAALPGHYMPDDWPTAYLKEAANQN